MSLPKRCKASLRYLAQAWPSRISAPRRVNSWCWVCRASSPVSRTLCCGKKWTISAGASVPGVSMLMISTPSISRRSIGWVISRVGGIRVMVPLGSTLAPPRSSWPRSLRGRVVPNWYSVRRLMALPARTFSAIVCSMKPTGAMICTLPALTSASSTTPLTPP
ncbi:hypothetical protein D9M70_465200 [compost metagenome]